MATPRVISNNMDWKKRKHCNEVPAFKLHQAHLDGNYEKSVHEEIGKLHMEKFYHSKQIVDCVGDEKKTHTEMAQKDAMINKQEGEMTSMMETINSKNLEIDELYAQKAVLELDINRKNQNINELNSYNASLEADVSRCDINMIIIKEDNDSLSRENIQLENEKVEFDNLSHETVSLKKIIDVQKETISQMNDDLENERLVSYGDREILQNQVDELKTRVNEFLHANHILNDRLERQQNWDLYSNLPCDDDF